MTFMRTQTKNEVTRLRESLEPDDRTLLILRIDRKLAWEDIARVLIGDNDADESEVRRRSATLRKRFERVKERLKKLAQPDAG
jgi:RNA polymerase sigma-70 factor, ECF subfamily